MRIRNTEELGNFPKVTQLINSGTGVGSHIYQTRSEITLHSVNYVNIFPVLKYFPQPTHDEYFCTGIFLRFGLLNVYYVEHLHCDV